MIAQILACLVNDTINYFSGVLCFYTTSSWGINQMKEVVVSFLSGTLLPLSFFPEAIGKVFTYLPFAGMAYNPILILMGKASLMMSIHYIGFSLSWLIILNILGAILFNHASKKITVQGG